MRSYRSKLLHRSEDLYIYCLYIYWWALKSSKPSSSSAERPNLTARRSYASTVLGVVILSVCLPVRLSVTCMLCDKTKQCTADILIPHERTITPVFWHQQWLVSDTPFIWNLCSKWLTPFKKHRLRQICTYNISTVRDSEKSQLWRLGSWPWAFQRAVDGVRMLPLSPPKGGSKSDFLFLFNKIHFWSNKVQGGSFLCVKTSSSKVVVYPFAI